MLIGCCSPEALCLALNPKAPSFAPAPGGVVRGHDPIAVFERTGARRDDPRAAVEAGGNLDGLAVADADFHRHELRRHHVGARAPAARALSLGGWRGDEHAGLSREVDERVARDGDRVAARVDRELHPRIHARLQPVADVRHFDLEFGRARRRIEDRRDTADAALEDFARVRVDLDVGRRAHRHATHVALDQVRHHPHGADVDHRGHRRVRAGKRAGIEVALADEAVDRRHDLRVRQADLQLVESGLGLFELRLGKVELRDGRLMPRVDVIERLLRQQLAIEEAARAVEAALRQLQVRLALANRRLRDLIGGLRAADLLADFAVLDASDDLSLPHGIAELHAHDLQTPVGARHDFDRRRADEVADDQDLLGDRRPLGRGELDRHRRSARAAPTAGCRTAARRVSAAVVHQHTGQADDGHDYDRDGSAHWTLESCLLLRRL